METKYSTLVHELAHIYTGHLGKLNENWWKPRTQLPKDVEEIEAESISFLVCGRNGLKTSSDAYLSDYIKNNKHTPAISMDIILSVSGYIESLGKPSFRHSKKN